MKTDGGSRAGTIRVGPTWPAFMLADGTIEYQLPDPIATLRAELDQPHEVPTATDLTELPDPSPNPYPLARIERQSMTVGALLSFLFRLWLWRLAERRRER